MLDKHRKKKIILKNLHKKPSVNSRSTVGSWGMGDSHLAIGECLLHDIIVYIFAH